MHDSLLVTYVVFAIIVAGGIALSSSSLHKMIVFVFSLWILAGAVLGTEMFVIPLGKAVGFDLQFNRILTILLLIYLAGKRFLWPREHPELSTTGYEKLLYAYFALSVLSLVVHLSDGVTPQELVVKLTGWMTFVVFYLVMKRESDVGMVRAIFISLLCLGVVSSIVGLIQFFVNPDFLRIGIARDAFGDKMRSYGVFDAEYTQSYFIIPAIVVALTTIRSTIARFWLIALYAVGVGLTFHRMSWGIALLLMGAYFVMNTPRKMSKIIIAMAAILPLTFVIANLPIFDLGFNYVSDRIFSDTVTGRVDLYQVALDRLGEVWLFGIGSVKTGTYYIDMMLAGDLGAVQSESGGIHNLFLNMAYFYGIPVVACFIMFVAAMFRFFWRKLENPNKLSFLPVALITMFILANMTNWFYLNMEPPLLFAVLMGLLIGSYQKNLSVQACVGGADAS